MQKTGNQNSSILETFVRTANSMSKEQNEKTFTFKKPRQKSLKEIFAQLEDPNLDMGDGIGSELDMGADIGEDMGGIEEDIPAPDTGNESAKSAWKDLGVALFGDIESASGYLQSGVEEDMAMEDDVLSDEPPAPDMSMENDISGDGDMGGNMGGNVSPMPMSPMPSNEPAF